MSKPPVIHWFRRDLRLADNTALNAALRDSGGNTIPVFVLSQWRGSHRWTGAPRQEYLCRALAELAERLEDMGSGLVLRSGAAVQELERLITETGATAIYYNRDPDPFGREMEIRVSAMARLAGVRAVGFGDVTVQEPTAVLTGAGKPFRVFTPYSRAWLKLSSTTEPGATADRFSYPDASIRALFAKPSDLPTLERWGLSHTANILEPGELAARRRMETFFAGRIFRYADQRDLPAANANSRFSADLRWGTLSIRELVKRCRLAADSAETAAQRNSAQTFLNELVWREFYMAVLWHWPETMEHEFQPQFRGLEWAGPGEAFDRWCEGTTGFPIVDAGMRQLAATGYMHNRVRMIVAMFLTKDLHLDWRLGERFFMQRLVDGEIASNNGGWQWSAGTGADAAPYFRIQNPWTQTAKFDLEGEYIKKWVPELRDTSPAAFAKEPKPGLRIAKGYPMPIVDHATERAVTLEMFKAAK